MTFDYGLKNSDDVNVSYFLLYSFFSIARNVEVDLWANFQEW